MGNVRVIEIKESVFADNDATSKAIREKMSAQGTLFLNVMSGPGSGKTTLLKVLGMLDKPEKGTVFYKGKDTKEIYGTELAKIRRTELSFIFQDF